MRVIVNSKDVFGREKKDNVAIVLINRSDIEKEINLEIDDIEIKRLYNVLDNSSVEITNSSLSVKLQPFGYKVLLKNK